MRNKFSKASKTKEPDNVDKAYEYAVFLLSLRLRTEAEVREKMKGRGYNEDVIEAVIKQLLDQKYVDDRRFAEVFLENLKTYRSFGYYGIKKKMMEKRLPQPLIEEILSEGLSVAEEVKIARRLLAKEGFEGKEDSEMEEGPVYRTFADDDSRSRKSKMANRLKSRGFRSEVISKVLF